MNKSTDLSSILEAELVDALGDIKRTRGALGKFSLRYVHEAIYGEEYTRRVLGDDARFDVLIEDIDIENQIVDGGIKTRIRDGAGRFSGRELTDEERVQAQQDLDRQEQEVENAAVRSWEEGVNAMLPAGQKRKTSRSSDNASETVGKMAKLLSDMSPEERKALIEALKGM